MITDKIVTAKFKAIKLKVSNIFNFVKQTINKILFFKETSIQFLSSKKIEFKTRLLIKYNRNLMYFIDLVVNFLILKKRKYEVKAVYLERDFSKENSINQLEKLHALRMVEHLQMSLLDISISKVDKSSGAYSIKIQPKDKKPFISFETFIIVYIHLVQRLLDAFITTNSKLLLTLSATANPHADNNSVSIINLKKTFWLEDELLLGINNVFIEFTTDVRNKNYNFNITEFYIDLYLYEDEDVIGKEVLSALLKNYFN